MGGDAVLALLNALGVQLIAHEAEQRRHGVDLFQWDIGGASGDEADDAGGSVCIDEVASFHLAGLEHGGQRLRAIEQMQCHAIPHEGGQRALPGLKMREVILPQGDDDAQRRGREIVIPHQTAIRREARLQRGGRAVLDHIR